MIVWLIVTALLFLAISHIVPGWKVRDFPTALKVSLIYMFLSGLAFWLKLAAFLMSLPLLVLLPAAVVRWVLNLAVAVLVVRITDRLVDGFEVADSGTAAVGCIVLSVLQTLAGWLL